MGESLKPCVRSFCFSIDLKGACIFIAALRIIGSIFTVGYCIYLLLSINDDETRLAIAELLKEDDEEYENSSASARNIDAVIFFTKIIIYILIICCVINVIGSSLFIWGAIKKKPEKMKPYLVILTINVVLLALSLRSFDLNYFIAALIEIYILICSSSLYRIYLTPSEEQLNTVETAVIRNDQPPPQYSSCDNIRILLILTEYYKTANTQKIFTANIIGAERGGSHCTIDSIQTFVTASRLLNQEISSHSVLSGTLSFLSVLQRVLRKRPLVGADAISTFMIFKFVHNDEKNTPEKVTETNITGFHVRPKFFI